MITFSAVTIKIFLTAPQEYQELQFCFYSKEPFWQDKPNNPIKNIQSPRPIKQTKQSNKEYTITKTNQICQSIYAVAGIGI